MDVRVIYPYQIQNLEGKLLTLIEGLGLSEKQETAVKELFKDTYYRTMYSETIYVFGEYAQPAIRQSAERESQGQTARH